MGRRSFADVDGVLLTRTSSVHTFFMRMVIDILYLDGAGRVLGTARGVPPWCVRTGPTGTRHVLELAADAIVRLSVEVGDFVDMPIKPHFIARLVKARRGAAMVEFAIVAPIISLMGLGVIQYGMLFFAKSNINYASFMAARAGANEHADLERIRNAYMGAISNLYASGATAKALVEARAKAEADLAGFVRIELVNPTKESFEDWNDPDAQRRLGTGTRRVIPNNGLAFKQVQVKATSGQSLHDANVIKLRITHGFQPKVPMISGIYLKMLGWLDPKADDFHTAVVSAGRIPVVTHVALHMNSDAIELDNPVSIPGPGNAGNPVNPGDPPVSKDPLPICSTAGCTVIQTPSPPKCDPASDPGGCRPVGCQPGDITCDPACGVTMCCAPRTTGHSVWKP
jgi:Flp pilus assembly pilin Flp